MEWQVFPVLLVATESMSRGRIICVTLVAVASLAPVRGVVADDSSGPKTLLRWNYGKSSEDDDSEDVIQTDRPDFTESPATVGQGVFQIEGGYTFTSDGAGRVKMTDHSFPETLYRLGVFADWFELRADWDYEVQRTKTAGVVDNESGADDLEIGFKIALTPQQCCLPETGIIVELSVPTGADAFSANTVLPIVEYCYDWELNKKWSLAAETAIEGATDDVTSDTYAEFIQTASLEYSWTKQLKSYTEWYVLSPISADTNRPQYYFDAGFTYLLNNNVQWDIRAGVGLNEAADNFYAGSGLSVRFK